MVDTDIMHTVLCIFIILITTSYVLQTISAVECKTDAWINNNTEVSEDGVKICQGFNDAEAQICKTMISNFLNLMVSSTNQQQTHLVVSSCNRTSEELTSALVRENQLKLQLERANTMLEIYQQREKETKLEMQLRIQREIEIYAQLKIANDRKDELASKVEIYELACNLKIENIKTIMQANISTLQSRVESMDENLLQCENNKTLIAQAAETECQEKLIKQGIESQSNQIALYRRIENFQISLSECQATCGTAEQTKTTPEGNVASYTETMPTTTPITELPAGAVKLSTGIYLYHDEKYYWNEAREFCKARNMDLVAIETEEENEAVFNYAKSLPGKRDKHIYTSGCYSQDSGDYIWQSTGKPVNYTAGWYTRHPKSNLGYCIQLRMESKNEWGTYDDKEPFICEMQ